MSVKRFWLVAAVGALAALTASMGGSTAYGGSSAASAAAPIKIGALTPLTPGAPTSCHGASRCAPGWPWR